jgi:acyl-CoA reductase-like NAD-dependent aldehyde dehydrogenase
MSHHRQHQLFVGGKLAQSRTGETFTRLNPYDGTAAASFANADAADAEEAIRVARATFDGGTWPSNSARVRHDILVGAATLLRQRAEDFAAAIVSESGKPVTPALSEVEVAARTFEYYAGAALAAEGSAISQRLPNALGLVLKEPVGVAAVITAWNFPLIGVVIKLAPALAAGCTVVAKPSHLCSGPSLMLAELMTDAGLPDGVFNVLTSDRERGAIVGQVLASSLLVDKVAFTGSTTSGQAVMRAAAANTKRVALELGGKSANIVFADADLSKAAPTAITAFCFNSGQQCSAGSRLLVQRSIHSELVDAVLRHASEQVLGDPSSPRTTMGPLVSQQQFDRVTSYVDLGRTEGRLLSPEATAVPEGWFIPPTLIEVSNESRLAQEEVFGPVLAVIPFEDEAEAIRIANDTAYGLAGGVWTTQLNRAIRVAKAIRTGKMFVNCYNTAGLDDMPHGGYKNTGFGREWSGAGLEEFLETKTVQVLLS